MGISGLLPLLKEIQVQRNVSEFKGQRSVSGFACMEYRRLTVTVIWLYRLAIDVSSSSRHQDVAAC